MEQSPRDSSGVTERIGSLVRRLRRRGQRITPQRMAIVRAFLQRPDHPSAESLHRELAEQYPMLALSTVYNTLSLLVEMGEATEVSPATPEARFDPHTGDHCHLVCVSCRSISDLPLSACVEPGEMHAAAREYGFRPLREVHQVFGTCARCQAAEAGSSENN